MTRLRKPLHQWLVQHCPRSHQAAHILSKTGFHRVTGLVNQARMRLDLRETIQRQMFLNCYEPTQTEWFGRCLAPGDCTVDVGASFGWFTTLASSLVGPKGRVFAFEPSRVASGVIENAIRESGIANVVLTKAAVDRQAGSVTLFMPTTEGLHSPSLLPSDPSFVPTEVPVVVLDDFAPLQAVERIKLVKIDAEGYEPNVLDSMRRLIREKRIENVICEFNSGWLKRNATTPERLRQEFLDLGFRVREQTDRQENLPGYKGETFELQDVWFTAK